MEKKQTQIRLPSALYEKIKEQARKHNRSLNGQLMEFIQKGMKDGATEQQATHNQTEEQAA
jgi:hypothetical protein